jgi:hypothetical protein
MSMPCGCGVDAVRTCSLCPGRSWEVVVKCSRRVEEGCALVECRTIAGKVPAGRKRWVGCCASSARCLPCVTYVRRLSADTQPIPC